MSSEGAGLFSNMLKDNQRKSTRCLVMVALLLAATARSATNAVEVPQWLVQPLSLEEAIRTALNQNGELLKAQNDLEAAHGVAVQTRAIVLPKVRGAASYEYDAAVEKDPYNSRSIAPPKNEWSGSIRLVQSIYEGGRMTAAWRASKLIKEQAYQEYQTVVSDVVLDVRTSYYDVLLAEQQIVVQEAAVKLLESELENTKRRMDAGAVPRFNVLRAEVKVANARPKLIRARNAHRITKTKLATTLGYNIPTNVWDDIPLTLTTKLDTEPYDIALPSALAKARERRTELHALRTEIDLQRERVAIAKSGYKPSLGVFGGYNAHNSEYTQDFNETVPGALAGVQMTWDIFDGLATRGRVSEARARQSKATVNLDEQTRRVEQQVRIAYSSFTEAREVLESQKTVVERAEEAMRLADSRYEAGTGLQLDVLDAQTSLTEARTTQVDAARDYLVARARLERAIGLDVTHQQPTVPTKVETWKPAP